MLDNFEKAATLSFLWEGTGRTIGQAAIAGILANPVFTTVLPTCTTIEEVVEYAAAPELPLTSDEKAALDALYSRNFDHEDRFVMPLKSSV
jgi:aryl-alcohol dehydrogenase-like predicted oxidoreductase